MLDTILDWWEVNRRDVPWRATRDPYAVWVAEVMSVQTQLPRAIAAWEAWMARWPTVQALAAASLHEVLTEWQGLGYPRRARDLHASARIVAADGWPEPLERLPGVGPYVAAAIRCFAHEQPVLPRDTNVNRVLARRFPDGLDITAEPWRCGQALMEFGQRICTARPNCGNCPVAVGCGGPQAEGARSRPRRQARFEGSLRQRRGRLLARVLAEGRLRRSEADDEAARSLLADGLLAADGAWLLPPA